MPVADTITVHKEIQTDPFSPKVCHEDDAPHPVRELHSLTTGRVAYADGIRPEPRQLLPGYDTGVMMLLIGTFFILAINFRHYSTFLKTFTQDLWKVRGRQNIFDDHTLSETRVHISLIMLLCVSEGIIVYSAVARANYIGHIFGTVGLTSLLAAVYYLWQTLVYRLVGYLFTSSDNTTQWLKGFRASQCLLGLALVIPAMTVLFNPGSATYVILIGLTLYVISRIIFILKGFRIFYDNSFSLVYFILYLCTLEVVPPVLLCKAAIFLTLLFE